jgi:hypothetical protein
MVRLEIGNSVFLTVDGYQSLILKSTTKECHDK